MNDFNLISAQEMIMTACTNIERAEMERNNNLLKSWKYVVSSIKSNAVNGENLGMNLYTHSRIIDLKNNILLVETDHPGWIQTLRMYQKYILTGLKRGVPELKIASLAFRLKGTDVELHNQINEEKIRDEMKSRIEKDDEVLRKFDEQNKLNASNQNNSENSAENKEIPENLKKILDRLKNDILTDNK